MNDTFSWKRFGLLARAEMTGERRSMLLKLGGFALFCSVMYMLWNLNAIFGSGSALATGGAGYAAPRALIGVAMGFLVYYNISGSFRRFFSAGKASAAFMLPASRGEKFLYAVLLNLVAVPVILLGVALLTDFVWSGALGFDNICVETWRVWSNHKFIVFTEPVTILLAIGYGLCIFAWMAFFLTGAAVFRRRQFLWTTLVVFGVWMVFFAGMQVWVAHDFNGMVRSVSDMEKVTGAWMVVVWGSLWTAVWLTLAWRRFATLQITK